MSIARTLLDELHGLGVQLWRDHGQKLNFRAPAGVMTQDRLQALKQSKLDILELLAANDADPNLISPVVVLTYEIDGKQATTINPNAQTVDAALFELRSFYFPPERLGRVWHCGRVIYPP